jgi:hypothetical protein
MMKAVAELDGFELYAWITTTYLLSRDDCPEPNSGSVSPGSNLGPAASYPMTLLRRGRVAEFWPARWKEPVILHVVCPLSEVVC